ncbi:MULTISPECIES: OmpA family protein [Bacteria]|uniref:OmpA family protein n=1 Tax=Bacteria TaxID=2 RepID=UPI00103CCD60|nr:MULTISPECIES: OmpA family protein [Bacteria]QDM40908.1 OmpA family protein [Altererythrobacter sp. TH136]TCJ39892.1 OmpA family protein [Parafrankia sp. BMG5.11]
MRKLVIGLALASTAIASPSLARDGAWYVELDGGPMIVEDIDLDIGAAPNAVRVDHHKGYDFGGIVGYDFGFVRLEAEGSYRAADISTLTVGSTPIAAGPGRTFTNTSIGSDGDSSALSFMVNALADFGPDDGLQGFVGGGVGVARTKFDGVSGQRSGAGFLDDSDSGFAWQLLAGVRAPLTETIDVGLKYRFFNTAELDMVDSAGRDVSGKWRSHSLLGTIGFNFGGAPAPMQTCWDGTQLPMDATCPARPAPVTPPPPPPPAVVTPVCNKGPYIVFFEWDRSDITPEAATILNNAASAYANCGSASVMLAGHADRSGSAQYNVGLSQRRAATVRSYLSGRGVPDTRIATEAFGESQPRVPTADGVRELQNRRVEVTYGPGSGM